MNGSYVLDAVTVITAQHHGQTNEVGPVDAQRILDSAHLELLHKLVALEEVFVDNFATEQPNVAVIGDAAIDKALRSVVLAAHSMLSVK